MEKLSIVSIVARYIATLLVHFITIVIGFESNQDFLHSPKQQMLGLEFENEASPSLNSLLDIASKFI